MKANNWVNYFRIKCACGEALIEAKEFDTFQDWWDNTERADWMLWGLSRLDPYTILRQSTRTTNVLVTQLSCVKNGLKIIIRIEG